MLLSHLGSNPHQARAATAAAAALLQVHQQFIVEQLILRERHLHPQHARADPLHDFPSLFSTAVFYCPYSRKMINLPKSAARTSR